MPKYGGREFSLEQLFQIRDSMEGLSDDQKRMLLTNALYGNGAINPMTGVYKQTVPEKQYHSGIETKYLQLDNGMTAYNEGMSLDDLLNMDAENNKLKKRYPSGTRERVPRIRGHQYKGML